LKIPRISQALLWNMASFALVGAMGILINVLIVRTRGDESFGVFNQVYAVFLMLSQLAVGGVHLSVQRFIPIYAARKQVASQILYTALLTGMCISAAVIALAWVSSPLIENLLNSPAVRQGYEYCLIGLLFFTFNKILISYHNGLQNFRIFALLQFLRMGFIFLYVAIFCAQKCASATLCLSLPLAELSLFLFCVLCSIPYCTRLAGKKSFYKWMRINFAYGNKAFFGNFLLDINTKADVFILGIFFSDAQVGIYSVASTFAEGFMQLASVLRNLFNPVLARLRFVKKKALSAAIIRRFRRQSFMLISALGLLAIFVFPVVLLLFGITDNMRTYWIIFGILVAGYASTSGYQSLLMVFNQYGKPSLQTVFVTCIFLSNVFLNLLLVPFFGITGAAAATATSFLLQVLIQQYLMKEKLGIPR